MKRTTIKNTEIEKFSKIAEEWWKPDGKFKPLHKFNPIRIKYIRDSITKKFGIKDINKPLKKLDILDIGCGGGLLSEPISRLGADVTAIDPSDKNINIAKARLLKTKLKIKYFHSSPEKFKTNKKFDVILNMEVVEHVNDIELFISQTTKLLKKNGIMFIATINKTLKSYIMAIVGAEYILRWLPIGTHDWNQFVEPEKLIDLGKKNSLHLNKIDGVKFNLIQNKFKLSDDKSVNYIAEFYKN
tara:strand:- start:3033 stop:3761 length:729 start_codon:yes stop_codon:yes gene_type:complete